MKKKKFYVNEQRNRKWTEQQTGRKIEFANKYLYSGTYSDKFDKKRPKETNTVIEKEKLSAKRKKVIIAILCVVLISVGYTGMQIYMELTAKPAKRLSQMEVDNVNDLANATIELQSVHIDSVGLDGGVMLTSIISEAQENGYTSITFDAKRSDGSIGYASKLAEIDTFHAISSPATELGASVKQLTSDDILSVARICCYKDNVVPNAMADYALKVNGEIYKDKKGNMYLDPSNENVYEYIKDIVAELHNLGINVFVLYGCELPNGIESSNEYGFEILKSRLNADLGSQLKFIEQKEISLDGFGENGKVSNDIIKDEIASFEKINTNQTYLINTKIEDKIVVEQLIKNGVSSFIINR